MTELRPADMHDEQTRSCVSGDPAQQLGGLHALTAAPQ
jgi:hypothetical protein